MPGPPRALGGSLTNTLKGSHTHMWRGVIMRDPWISRKAEAGVRGPVWVPQGSSYRITESRIESQRSAELGPTQGSLQQDSRRCLLGFCSYL